MRLRAKIRYLCLEEIENKNFTQFSDGKENKTLTQATMAIFDWPNQTVSFCRKNAERPLSI